MAKQELAVVWFRQDLRLDDNPALVAAAGKGMKILPLFILDEVNRGTRSLGRASRWWLHKSLDALDNSLSGTLCLEKGDSLTILKRIVKETGATGVYWNRCYEPKSFERDSNIKSELRRLDVGVENFNGSLLFEPSLTVKQDGTPYKVFTPFYRQGCLTNGIPPKKPEGCLPKLEYLKFESLSLDDLNLLPKVPWYLSLEEEWSPGEFGARERLESFLESGLADYKNSRDYPGRKNVSRLSPHIHFGEVSPNRIWHTIKEMQAAMGSDRNTDHFLSELAWREFSYNLLYFNPNLPEQNLQAKFDSFPWASDKELLLAWQQGKTGYPIVDAGMKELWITGYMHNRVRMIVASFLVKNLMIDWRHGQKWFWDTLVDADLANNSASWQWVAGSGSDAAPFFRIFNPVSQGQKFDPDGEYVLKYLPHLKELPKKFVHCPWLASKEILTESKVELGLDYPPPIVDLKNSRERALKSFKGLSSP